MSVPKLRFSEFSGYWKEKKFGNFCSIKMGQSPSSKNYTKNSDDTILIQGNADLKKGKVIPRIFTSEITKTSEPGDIILTVRAPVGEIAINDYFACIGRGVCSIKGEQFIYYLLELIKEKNTWKRLAQGSTFEAISSSDINNLKIIIPSSKERTKISAFLSKMDNKIEKLENKQQLWKTYKKGIMNQIFSEKLRFKDETGEDFSDWEEKKLGKLCQIKTGNKDLKDKVDNGIYPFFVRSDRIERINTYSYDGEAILIPGDGRIGEVYHYIIGKFDYHQRVYKLSDFENNTNGKFLYYYLKENFIKQATKNSVKATVDSLRLPTFKEMIISLPTNSEQTKIANFLSAIEIKEEQMSLELEINKKFKNGLLQQILC